MFLLQSPQRFKFRLYIVEMTIAADIRPLENKCEKTRKERPTCPLCKKVRLIWRKAPGLSRKTLTL